MHRCVSPAARRCVQPAAATSARAAARPAAAAEGERYCSRCNLPRTASPPRTRAGVVGSLGWQRGGRLEEHHRNDAVGAGLIGAIPRICGDDARPPQCTLADGSGAGPYCPAFPASVDGGSRLTREVVVPVRIVGTASPRGNHHQRIAVVEIEQRNGVRLTRGEPTRREQQHVVAHESAAHNPTGEPVEQDVQAGEPPSRRVAHRAEF